MGLGHGVQIVVVAIVQIEVGELVVVRRQEGGEQVIVGATMGGDSIQALDRRLALTSVLRREFPHFMRRPSEDRPSTGRY